MAEVVEARQAEAGLRTAADAPRLGFWDRYTNHLIGLASVAGFLILWQITASLRWIDPLFISSPARVAGATVTMVKGGDLWRHLNVSLSEFALGFGLAILLGVPMGILGGWYERIFAMINPFVAGMNATPRVAFLPLIVIWLGVGIWSKVAVVFLGAFFPIVFNMLTALRTLDATLVKMARSLGARDGQIFRTIAMPAAVPFLVAGLRLGSGRGLVGIVVGELYAANVGVGYLIAIYGSTFQTDRLFVGIMIITGIGLLLDVFLRRMERRFELWRPHVS